MEKETACPCLKIDCELHGDCAPCFKRHARKGESPFCLRGENITLEPLEERVIARLKAAGIPLGGGI